MAEVEFGLLGPLLVQRDGVVIGVAAGKQRALLAALLLDAGRVVGADGLIEVLWDTAPPTSARASLHNYVKRLRKALGDAGHFRISTHPHGYMISVEPGELDIHRFLALEGTARAAARTGSLEAAAVALREALALWRGPALADVVSAVLTQREVPRLEEMRLRALEARIDIDLALGRHAEVITELRHLADCHPLRERLHALLMLALYRDARQAEALAAYRHAHQILADELGIEPGLGLRKLHQGILAADPSLDTSQPAQMPASAGPGGPRELPAPVAHFTGRADEKASLTRLLDAAADQVPATVVISAIGGTAGVGKTALAVHWAHQAAGRFPDGQLYVNLRGFDPGRPMPPTDALARFLRSMGVPGQDIPPDEDERAARYRSLLAEKRLLVILDNAGSADQVRPLLPGTPGCAVVVTSRDALTGLAAREGAARLELDVLSQREAIALLRRLIGARVDAEPQVAARLADQCCRLPLALRVAAELAASHQEVPLHRLAGELADLRTRLDLLAAGGDQRTEVRAVFSWSYHHLDTEDARTFRLLGLHPGPDLEPYAAAALTGTTVGQARRALDMLARAHLIQPAGAGRQGMHDLLRSYARELSATVDGAEEHNALTRLFDYYLHTAAAAMDTLFPAERNRRPSIPRPGTPVPPLLNPAAARDWLDHERPVLVAVAEHAVNHGWSTHAIRLATILFRYLESAGYYAEIVSINTHARRAARDTGDHAAEAEALNNMAIVDLQQGRYDLAGGQLEQALAQYHEAGDRNGEARTLGNLGILRYQQGRYQQAIGYQQRSLRLRRDSHDRTGEANTLNNLGLTQTRHGSYAEAAGHLEQALALYREAGDRNGEAYALSNLGHVYALQASHRQAADRLGQALMLFRETSDPVGEAAVLVHLGELNLLLGRHTQAGRYHELAMALSRNMGDQSSEAEALNGLGEVLLASDQPGEARTQHATALELASRIGDRYQQARAHRGLARAYRAAAQPEQARSQLERALALYSDLGTPEADEVRAQLTAADNNSRREQKASGGC